MIAAGLGAFGCGSPSQQKKRYRPRVLSSCVRSRGYLRFALGERRIRYKGGKHAIWRIVESLRWRRPPPARWSCRSALTFGAAQAQDKTYVMKITLPTINDAPHQFAKNFAAAVEKDSGGRIKGEVYPASQLGSIPRQIEGVQFGAIQGAVIPPEFFVGVDERFEVMAAPGLVDSHRAWPARRRRSGGAEADAGAWRQQGTARRRPVHGPADLRSSRNADPPPRRLQGQEDPDLRLAIPNRGVRAARRDAGGDDARRRAAGAAAGRHRRRDRRHHGVLRPLHFQDAAKYVTETNQPAIFLIARGQQEVVRLAAARTCRRSSTRDGAARVGGDQSTRRSNCSQERARPGRRRAANSSACRPTSRRR